MTQAESRSKESSLLTSSSDVTTEGSSNADQPVVEATARRSRNAGPGGIAMVTKNVPVSRASCHRSGRAAVNTRLPHHTDTGTPCSFSEMEPQCGAEAERASSKILLLRPPKCPPHSSLHHHTRVCSASRWPGRRKPLRFTACGWKELMKKINRPSELAGVTASNFLPMKTP